MTDDGDTQRLLGELVASGKARARQMDRIEKTLERLVASHTTTRSMVLEDRAATRALKWAVGVMMAALGALGLDWWAR